MLQHSFVEKTEVLGDQMQRMNLAEGISVKSDKDDLYRGRQYAQKMRFDDKYFLEMLARDLPRVSFCAKPCDQRP